MFIPIILGTARQGRETEKAAKFMLEEVKKAGLETEIIDVREFIESFKDAGTRDSFVKSFSGKIKRADALIIVSPEYNHSFPGELKMLLDTIRDEYVRKPVGFCGVSNGFAGGVRMVEQLRLVMIDFRMVPIREAMYFSTIQNLFDENGRIKDSSYRDRIKKFLDELLWYAQTLKKAKEG